MVTPTVITPVFPATRSIEWSPVIAGSILAGAISLLLIQFGNGLGLSFSRINSPEMLTVEHVIYITLWVVWVQLMASMAGAYLTGRMLGAWPRDHEGELRDGAHGLLVWALSSVLTAVAVALTSFTAVFLVQHGAEPQVVMSDTVAHKAGIITGFGIAASSLVSAAAAWGIASLAGDHRDRNADVRMYITFRRKR